MKQVNKDSYNFERYSHLDRWASYYYQLREVLKLNPKSILEVGVGDKVFGEYIRNNTSITYKNVDIAEDLSPDIIGSVTDMPVDDGTFDVVCAFEVLEHIPFEQFEKGILEMARISKKYIVVSVPHFGPPLELSFKVPFIPRIKISCKIPFPRKHLFNGQHYWEIGKREYPLSKILKILESHFRLLDEFVPFENQYHHFFVLEKKA